MFRKDKYLSVAIKCAEVIWRGGLLKKGYGICHGIAGNAYAFLGLYKQTDDPKYLYRAMKVSSIFLGPTISPFFTPIESRIVK